MSDTQVNMVISIHTPTEEPWSNDQDNDAYALAEDAAEELTAALRELDPRCRAEVDV